ncbi:MULTISPECIES: heme A synthase [unclassified Rothia (in: high G+C Gram-positive bacteria)]|uniref:COX15/CtaA family protein n=1 Tax=unclassified Rothia (in: high G+C Gram-positive bacteria) TaxID=2689056 RepID=UPI00195EE276|nr:MULTISPECIES: COX15/CtaA family protein [unclassified Rothia (in: high G+C Gram-positive bacteria)]MBM7050600.1 COX15/CtaA family protein [Rothia sp. ZJ1223]QRZ60795.1 COX15/CtaA family protein [Rothia sp. ZJ932]
MSLRTLGSRFATRYIPEQYTSWVRATAWGMLLANIGIVATGGIVRLTGSGLGCDNWPKCNADSWTVTPEMGIHGAVEFGNRLLTFVLMAFTIAAFLAILRLVFARITVGEFLEIFFKRKGFITGIRTADYHYADLFNLALMLLWGIPIQAVVGGISVWLKLNPWMITAHYVLSAIMIALAAIYLNRVYRYFGDTTAEKEELTSPALPNGTSALQTLGWIGTLIASALIFIGTVVTGTGPHAGDPMTHRHAFDPVTVTRIHSITAWVYCAGIVVLFVLAKKYDWSAAIRSALTYNIIMLLFQAAVGYYQYFNGLPILVVELHLIGSALFTWAAASLIERMITLSRPSNRKRALARLNVSGK